MKQEAGNDCMTGQIPHTDSRTMQALPWRVYEDDKCHNMVADNGKEIATFWGNDERDPQNMQWCTKAQRERHAKYVEHVCNSFPFLMVAIEAVYKCEEMPEDAIKIIEATMEKHYFEEVPPYVGR